MRTAAEIMDPYFHQIEQAILAAGAKRIDELVNAIFNGN